MKYPWLCASLLTLALALGGCGTHPENDAAPAAGSSGEQPPSAWTIGIYDGPSPFALAPPAGIKNPVLRAADVTDLDVDIVAHPFLAVADSRYYLFFTAKEGATEMGGIGLAESTDGLHWEYKQAVLQEPFTLSHPFVFKWREEYYMVPEAYKETAVRLYRATSFPDEWTYEGNLLEGDHYVSPTLVRYQNRWWMFTSPVGNRTLRLFYAENLKGPWTEHPQSPIVADDPNTARPAGRPFFFDGILYRLGQDCEPTYGNQVHAFRIDEMTPAAYSETIVEAALVKASSEGWNAEAMHHVDAHQVGENRWIAAVDALGR